MYKRTFNPCDECDYGIDRRDGSGNDSMCKICEFRELLDRRAQPENEPLTLEELRQMDGEPVWCVKTKDNLGEWAICRVNEMSKTWFIASAGASRGFGDRDNYGKTWLAYRRKPERSEG